MLVEPTALLGRNDAILPAHQKVHAELLLKHRYLLADALLGHKQFLCCL